MAISVTAEIGKLAHEKNDVDSGLPYYVAGAIDVSMIHTGYWEARKGHDLLFVTTDEGTIAFARFIVEHTDQRLDFYK